MLLILRDAERLEMPATKPRRCGDATPCQGKTTVDITQSVSGGLQANCTTRKGNRNGTELLSFSLSLSHTHGSSSSVYQKVYSPSKPFIKQKKLMHPRDKPTHGGHRCILIYEMLYTLGVSTSHDLNKNTVGNIGT